MSEATGEPWSFSRLERFTQCPRRWWAHYIAKVPERPSAAAQMGTLVHRAVQIYGKAWVTAGHVPSDAAAIVRAAVTAAWHDIPPADRVVPDEDWDEALRMTALAARWLDRLLTTYATWTAAWEQPVRWVDGGRRFLGYADLVLSHPETDHVIVVDFKTGYGFFAAAETPQVAFYGWGLGGLTAERLRVWGQLWFLRLGIQEPAGLVPLAPAALAQARDWAHATIGAIEERLAVGADAFPPTPGTHCLSCPVMTTCPLADAATEPPFPTADAASAAGARLLVLEAQAKALRDALQQWVRQHGPVAAGSEWWAFYPRTTWTWPSLAKLEAVLAAHGMPDPIVRPDEARLRKLRETYPWLDEAGVPEVSWVFTHRKRPPAVEGGTPDVVAHRDA